MQVTCKQGDTPTIPYTFTDTDGEVINLSSGGEFGEPDRVRCYVSLKESGILVVNRDATITNASGGEVEITLEQAETALEGLHRVEFEAVWSNQDTTNITSPSDDYIRLNVFKSVGSVSAQTIASTTLSGPIDAGGNDITNGGVFAATTLKASNIRDADTNRLFDIGSLGSNFPGVSKDGTQVLSATTDYNFTASGDASVTVTDDGDSSATVEISATGGGSSSLDIDDGTTTVTDISALTVTASGDAAVDVSDDGDGTATLNVNLTAGSGGSDYIRAGNNSTNYASTVSNLIADRVFGSTGDQIEIMRYWNDVRGTTGEDTDARVRLEDSSDATNTLTINGNIVETDDSTPHLTVTAGETMDVYVTNDKANEVRLLWGFEYRYA